MSGKKYFLACILFVSDKLRFVHLQRRVEIDTRVRVYMIANQADKQKICEVMESWPDNEDISMVIVLLCY